MSFFTTGKRPSIIQSGSAPVIRKVLRPVEQRTVTKTLSSNTSSPSKPNGTSSVHARNGSTPTTASRNARATDKNSRLNPQRRLVKRKQSTPDVVFSSNSEDGSSDEAAVEGARKKIRQRRSSSSVLNRRSIRDRKEYYKDQSTPFQFIHSAQLVAGRSLQEYKPTFPSEDDVHEVRLQYPGSSRKERFNLVYPEDSKEYRPLVDIIESVTQALTFYLPPEASEPLLDDLTGLPAQLKRAATRLDKEGFMNAVNQFNRQIQEGRANGKISSTLDSRSHVPFALAERIISQVYERTISPKADTLRKYESFSDSTYGEILPMFASQIFREAKLTPKSVFVDLGSGVGSIVLQAALEYGCESYGIEFEEIPAALANAQATELTARARLWGLDVGSVDLWQGDFFNSKKLSDILRRADVVLVNNQAFSSITNDRLVSLFLDVKEGARIVSLKSFVPSGFEIDDRTSGDPRATLSVVRCEYWTGYVSWKAEGGEYYIATKDMTELREFYEKESGKVVRAKRGR